MRSPFDLIQEQIVRLRDQLAGVPRFERGRITSVAPLRVQLDGADAPLAGQPDSLVALPRLGQYVQVMIYRHRATLIGAHDNGEWHDCTLRWNWEPHPTYGSVQARLYRGIVEMRGAMRNGSLTPLRTIVQLPAGFEPTGTRPIPAHFLSYGFPLFAYSHGGMQFSEAPPATNWISFEGVSFAI